MGGIFEFLIDFDVLIVVACAYVFSIAGYAIVVSYLDAPDKKPATRRAR